MPKLHDYLRIGEAAEYLGVAPNTLRNWGKSGKITELRHPVNGYRLYSREQLDELLRQLDPQASRRGKSGKPK